MPPLIIKLSFFCEIDTTGIKTWRIKEILPAVLTSSINSKFSTSPGINLSSVEPILAPITSALEIFCKIRIAVRCWGFSPLFFLFFL